MIRGRCWLRHGLSISAVGALLGLPPHIEQCCPGRRNKRGSQRRSSKQRVAGHQRSPGFELFRADEIDHYDSCQRDGYRCRQALESEPPSQRRERDGQGHGQSPPSRDRQDRIGHVPPRTPRVCVAMDSTNQPVRNTSGLVRNHMKSAPKVTRSKTEDSGPITAANRTISCIRQRGG